VCALVLGRAALEAEYDSWCLWAGPAQLCVIVEGRYGWFVWTARWQAYAWDTAYYYILFAPLALYLRTERWYCLCVQVLLLLVHIGLGLNYQLT